MTAIYLAGKIATNDWRHQVVPLRGAWIDASEKPDEPWPVLRQAVFDTFDYIGPYFVSDDHGCGHGPNTHGCGANNHPCFGHPTIERGRLKDRCLSAIKRADLVFVWLDDVTAFWTLVEIGYAHALGKKLVVATPPGAALDDLWFAQHCADPLLLDAGDPIRVLRFLADLERDNPTESPIEEAFWRAHKWLRLPSLAGLVAQHVVGRYRVDFALPAKRIGIELDGYSWHSSPEAFTRDRQRERELEAIGWRIIRFSGSEVKAGAERCVRQAADLVATWVAAP